LVRNDVRHWGAGWANLVVGAYVHDFRMVMAEDASQWSNYIAWWCPVVVVVVVAGSCATRPRRLAAYEVQN
jgi:hypothetical protein